MALIASNLIDTSSNTRAFAQCLKFQVLSDFGHHTVWSPKGLKTSHFKHCVNVHKKSSSVVYWPYDVTRDQQHCLRYQKTLTNFSSPRTCRLKKLRIWKKYIFSTFSTFTDLQFLHRACQWWPKLFRFVWHVKTIVLISGKVIDPLNSTRTLVLHIYAMFEIWSFEYFRTPYCMESKKRSKLEISHFAQMFIISLLVLFIEASQDPK